MTKRLFIAATIEEHVLREIDRVTLELKTANPQTDIKWVDLDNLHLTFQFLGDTPEEKINDIKQVIDEIAENCQAFSYQLDKLNAFPSQYQPRVIFIGLTSADIPKIADFCLTLAKNLTNLGLNIEKRAWKAHITLARIKPINRSKITLSSEIQALKGQIQAINLFESELTSFGPIYKKLHSAKLK